MYKQGRGVTQDDKEAVKWYRLASEQGDATGQFNLANKYEVGKGVAKDRAVAVSWYLKAARQGQVDAQKALTRLGETW